MKILRRIYSLMKKDLDKNISESEFNDLSKKFLFRELSYKEQLVSDVFDYRDLLNETPNNNFLITCEHATNKIHNYKMGDQKNFLDTHWGYDPGAKDMGLELAKETRLLSVFSNFSRLIIDPNRSLVSETLCRKFVEKTVELNMNKKGKFNLIIENLDRDKRILKYYLPYYNLLRETLLFIRPKYIISCHSFTPYYENDPLRDFEIGIMFREKGKLVEALEEAFTTAGMKYRLNEPYDMKDGVCHAQESMLSWSYPDKTEVVLIEFRNDYCIDSIWRKKVVDSLVPIIEKLNN